MGGVTLKMRGTRVQFWLKDEQSLLNLQTFRVVLLFIFLLCKNEEKEHETNLKLKKKKKFILSKLCEACDQSFLGLGRVEEVKIQLDQKLEVETSVAYDLKRYQEVLDDNL